MAQSLRPVLRIAFVTLLGLVSIVSAVAYDSNYQNPQDPFGSDTGLANSGGSSSSLLTSATTSGLNLEQSSIHSNNLSIGSVSRTLALNNGSLYPGNFLPRQCNSYTEVAIAPTAARAYVTCRPEGLIVYNETSGAAESLVHIGAHPLGLAVDDPKGEVYVADSGSSNVSVVSTLSSTLIGTIPVGAGPTNISYDAQNEILYVTDFSADNLSEISSQSNAVVGSIQLDVNSEPSGIVYDPSNGDLYVAEWGLNTIEVVSTANDSLSTPIPVYGEPASLGYDPANGDIYSGVYVAENNSNIVRVISGVTQRIVANITVGFDPSAVVCDGDSDLVYVANSGDDNVSVISGSSQRTLGSIEVGGQPTGLALSNSPGLLFVTGYSSSNLGVVNLTTSHVLGYTSLDTGPEAMAVDGPMNAVYVANWYASSVMGVDSGTNQLISTAALPSYGLGGVAMAGPSGHLYVTCEICSQVFDLNLSGGPTRIIDVGREPVALAFNSLNGQVYAVNLGSGSVSVIDSRSDSVVVTVSLGPGLSGLGTGGNPIACEFDPANGNLYVAVHGDYFGDLGNITIINGSSDKIVGAVLGWPGPGPSGVAIDQENNVLYVTDDSANVVWAFNLSTDGLIGYTPVGLQPESIGLDPQNGFLYTANSGSNNVSVIDGATNLALGSITVGGDPTGLAVDGLSGNIYVANYGSGTLSIISGALVPRITFNEDGLPAGTEWWANVSGEPAQTSNGTSISLGLPLGDYSYSVAASNTQFESPGGKVAVSGAETSVDVVFTLVIYAVTFTEVGLPSGTPWWQNLSDGKSFEGNGTTILTSEPNGSYYYSLAAAEKTYSALGGEFTVSGQNVTESVTFTRVTFLALFEEAGLGAQTNWSVIIGSQTVTSHSSNLTFTLTNGTYPFMVSSVAGYSSFPVTGSLTISGQQTTFFVHFTANSSSGGSVSPWVVLGIGVVVLAMALGIAFVVLIPRRRDHWQTKL